jgi:acyl-CoA synthetase (AMP-forming)/AMP-acid ligase II
MCESVGFLCGEGVSVDWPSPAISIMWSWEESASGGDKTFYRTWLSLEAAVVGEQDGNGLTKVKAFVVVKAERSVTEEEPKAFVKERLAPYKYPRLIAFVDDLPKTATGKIQRFKLRGQ